MKETFNKLFNKKDTNYFYRLIGVNESYNDELKLFYEKFNNKYLIFDNEIPISPDFNLIEYVYKELETMNVYNIKSQEITLFEDRNINNIFLDGLQKTIDLSIINEKFMSDGIRNNFITKIIVWAFTYLKEVDMYDEINPKVLYFGEIDRHQIYFLFLLYYMKFDVLYINPLKENNIEKIDNFDLTNQKMYMKIEPAGSFFERIKKGNSSNVLKTTTKQIEEEVHQELFSNTGIYKPWQFRNYNTKSILLDTIVEDIFIYFNEPSRLREGFEVSQNEVSVPVFFFKIDGEYKNKEEFQKLVKQTTKQPNTLFFNTPNFSRDVWVNDEILKLMFLELSDGTYDLSDIKKLNTYTLSKYSNETQNFILSKFNETILRNNIYVNTLQREEKLRLLNLILNMNEEILKLIESFDFADKIPKLVIYLNNEEDFSDAMTLLLGYLSNVGFDIIIFNPSSLCNLSNILRENRFIKVRLEEINYKSNYKMLPIYSKQNVFGKLFNNFR